MTMLFDFFKKKAVVEKVEPAAKAGAKVVAKKFTPTKAKAVVDTKFKPGQGAAVSLFNLKYLSWISLYLRNYLSS
jgi:hypothetical protein